MKDIFISYRRVDGETVAFLLYKDLSNDGYAVFYDHKSLGGGNFKEEITRTIEACNDVVIILSASSFSDKIFEEKDVYRLELEVALSRKKRIVGIMLEDFPGFPDKLPESIENIRNMNCLKLYMSYYEAMYNRLTSGSFLSSLPRGRSVDEPSQIAMNSAIPKELETLSRMPASQKSASVQMLLNIMDSFNKSEICMRFYHYIDIYDRKHGVENVPAYEGVIPTDLVTYLSFFETLYIIVASGALDLSVIDFAYRFRFFAGCNNPTMQESELLPLGYQYPNIVSFYNMWCNYIVERYDHSMKCDSISSYIPLYEYDLHKRYAAYCFAHNPIVPVRIRFLNRYLNWMDLVLKRIEPSDLDTCMSMQERIFKVIDQVKDSNIFEPLSSGEMKHALRRGYCFGLFQNEQLVAQMNLLSEPDDNENLMLDLGSELREKKAAVLDLVIVDQTIRGYGTQKTLLYVAECIAANQKKDGIIAVTSPRNTYSIKNFISQGYRIIATLPKYKSTRHYLWKSCSCTQTEHSE